MKVTGSFVQQVDKTKPKGRCRDWRLFVSTEEGRRSRRFKGTYSDAERELKAFANDVASTVLNAETFASYAENWRSWREASGRYAPGTCANDRRCINALLRSPIAPVRMDDLDADICRESLIWVRDNAERVDRLSGTSLSKIHSCLRTITRQAYRDGRISRDPMEFVEPPKLDTKEKEHLTPEQMDDLLDWLDAMPMDGRVMAVMLIVQLGLRRGEACALMDSDVSDGIAHVHLAVKERSGTIGEPKSKAGVRYLPMPPRLESQVKRWRRVRESKGYGTAPTLACNTQGGTLRPQLLQRWWSGDAQHIGVSASLGCEGITLHQLRHSNISKMARYMSPFDLQQYAGWSSLEPARVYVHKDLGKMSKAVHEAWLKAPEKCQNEKRSEA